MAKRRTPQEKKALSHEKDGRSIYGENDKASRKAIPLRKRLVNRANRHHEQQVLSDALGAPDAEGADATEQHLLAKRPKVWRKTPDRPLGEVLRRSAERRERLRENPRKSDEARSRRRRPGEL